MKPRSQSQKDLNNFQSDMDKNVLNSQNDKNIDKAKAELKILKKFINDGHGDHGRTGKQV
jgi:hypothetical protein